MQLRDLITVTTGIILATLWTDVAAAQIPRDLEIKSQWTGSGYSLCGSCLVPAEISWRVWLTTKDEPGEQIVLSGVVYKSDGVTADSGVTLFVYQTDAGGYYHRPTENVFHPRIAGWLRTGKDGRYEIHTIKPAPEILAPKEPAHIHVHIFGNGMPEHFLHEFWFQGDSRVSDKDAVTLSKLGRYSPLVNLTKDYEGVLRGVRDIRVRPAEPWKYEEN